MTATYEHLKRWTMPQYYMGASWPQHYSAGVGQSRDSDALERANFDAMLKALGGESTIDRDGEDVEMVVVVRENHWAVGWIEWIAIHQSNDTALAIADGIMKRKEDYPVIDEELFSQYEDQECETVWSKCFNAQKRIEYFRKHSYTCGALSDLMAAVRGSWYHAANMLHCPSDLLY